MKQVLIRKGQPYVENVPAPMEEKGAALVQVSHSCISTGTELSGMQESSTPLWKRALKNPAKIKKALQMLGSEGFSKTKSVIEGKLQAGTVMGYSAAGTILGSEKRVACAGAQCANHSEIIKVPENLMVPIPKNLSFEEASTVALGAIALQGVRRAQPTLGETFVVIGLGFIGQVTAQLLQANGCRVFGVDLDPTRKQFAEEFGISTVIPDFMEVDGVIITAATSSSEVISTAFHLCRKKGRVVLVGDVGLDLKRADFYRKEIDFLISTSYGPGRYDDRFEEKGIDYPIGYVRWTETRNMEEYLRLLDAKKVNIQPFLKNIFPVEEASSAYDNLKNMDPKPLLALLSYPSVTPLERVIPNPYAKPTSKNQLQVALIGAGGFAKGMHLPNIKVTPELNLRAVVSKSGANAVATMKQFEASYSSTDYEEVLKDEEIDFVIIANKHHLHAEIVLASLKAGKHVLVEKPLCLNPQELQKILDFYSETPDAPILLTGFNRRFSKYMTAVHKLVQKRVSPMVINYRMNAGYIPLESWIFSEEGGGRNLGEACHIYDLFTYLTASKVLNISTQSIRSSTNDNFIVGITFQDGSIATLTYTSLGDKNHPKEQMEIYVDGKVLSMNDYRFLNHPKIETRIPEKGQKEELNALIDAIQNGGVWPIPLWQQAQAMEIAFEVEKQLGSPINSQAKQM